MPRRNFNLPHVRRKAQLQTQVTSHRIKIAEHKEKMDAAKAELQAMSPPKPKPE